MEKTRQGGLRILFADDEVKRFEALPSDQARQDLALASLAAFVREVILNPVIPPI